MLSTLRRLIPLDSFVLLILAVVVLASLFPAQGRVAEVLDWATKLAIGLLFFLHGARLSTRQALDGLKNVKLHLAVLGFTFVIFPILGVAAKFLPPWLLSPDLVTGTVYLTLNPSTVQSSIAFTSIAGGDVAAAMVAASASSLLGVFITPALTFWLLGSTSHGGVGWRPVLDIVLQLLLPFLLGQAARPVIGEWVRRHAARVKFVDQSSILLVVYAAFSLGVTQGIWQKAGWAALLGLTVVTSAMLGIVLALTSLAGRALRFEYPERVVLLFCGSKKSLASGLPMATVLFPPAQLGLAVLPLMVFHQIQLIVCTVISGRLGKEHHVAAPARPA